MLNYLICGVVIVLLLLQFASYDYIIRNISFYINDIATERVEKLFKKNNQKFRNANGEIGAVAVKAIKNEIRNTTSQFYSKDFYTYYRKHRPILKFRVKKMISKYLTYQKVQPLHDFNNITPEQFFELRQTVPGDMVGVYVLYNKNKRKYYVGQATRLFFRVNQHFTGHGNGDVYADYKRGHDHFTIQLIPLVNSGYYDLDKLEKDLIEQYNAYTKGYNKTIGNS